MSEGPSRAGAVFSSAASRAAVLPCPYMRVRAGQAGTGDSCQGTEGEAGEALALLTHTWQPSPFGELWE